jgi:eukaryotic-like serine/threonine-protein kinase
VDDHHAESVVPMELRPGQTVGEYRVGWKLGEGGMASVYAATHPVIGKRAAIKILHPELCADLDCVERFVQEARAANSIGHPNIVDVFSFGKLADGRSYFVMEWLRGQTLSARLEHGPVPLAEALEILEQTCDALEAAHEKGIIHRDLKPDNIFLVPVRGGRQLVKLLDFGIAKLVGNHQRRRFATVPCLMGTPEYISPEQAGGQEIDQRTDIYALGVIAYEMLAGRLPFAADSVPETLQLHLHAQPEPLRKLKPDLPGELDALVLALLAKQPDARPALALVHARLHALRSACPVPVTLFEASGSARLPIDPQRVRSRRRMAAAAIVFVVSLAASTALLRARPLTHVAAPAAASVAACGPVAGPDPIPASPPAPLPTELETMLPDTASPSAPAPRPTRRAKRAARPAAGDRRGDDYMIDPFEGSIQ